MSWDLDSDNKYPEFVCTVQSKIVKSKLDFWKLANNTIFENGPFIALKLFKNAVQYV